MKYGKKENNKILFKSYSYVNRLQRNVLDSKFLINIHSFIFLLYYILLWYILLKYIHICIFNSFVCYVYIMLNVNSKF